MQTRIVHLRATRAIGGNDRRREELEVDERGNGGVVCHEGDALVQVMDRITRGSVGEAIEKGLQHFGGQLGGSEGGKRERQYPCCYPHCGLCHAGRKAGKHQELFCCSIYAHDS